MFQPMFNSIAFLITAICLLATGVWWSAPKGKNGRKRWGLILLRWVMLFVLAWVLARPSYTVTETEISPGNVIILVDTSRSMSVADEKVGEKNRQVSGMRYDAMREALGSLESATELAKMAEKTDTEVYALDSGLLPLELNAKNGKIQFPPTPDGNESALGASLLDTLERTAGRKVLGIVLLSDGAQRALPPRDALPQTAATHMRRLGIPLFTVPFGGTRQENSYRDVVVEDMIVEQRVFVDTEVTVSGRIRLDGVAKEKIPVELLVESASGTMETVAQTEIQASGANETLPVRMSWIPKTVGEVKVTLRLPPQQEEISVGNNQLDAFVTVAESGMKVLYLEQAFRPESSFLRRALDSAEEIQLDMVRLTKWDARMTVDLQKILSRDYSVIILGDVSAECFQPSDLRLLVQKIQSGTGLLTLGGLNNYASGGYARTALAQVLPVKLSEEKKSQHSHNSQNPQHSQWNQPVRMKLTVAGRHHLALALDAETSYSMQLWEKLPPLDGANYWEELKPGATVLASDFTEDKQEIPLLLEQSYGQGRVMSMAVDSTWRWWLAGFEESHKRFWRQLVFWVANQEKTLDGTVSILLPQRRFPQDQPIVFQVSARLSSGETPPFPAKNTPSENWSVMLQYPDGHHEEVPLTASHSVTTGKIPTGLPPGDYMLQASVTHQGQKIGENRCRFQVYHHDLELDRAQAEPALLSALALSTGGELVKAKELPNLWRRLMESREELKIEREIHIPLWDRWYWLTLILMLMTLEWFLRKCEGYA